MPLYELREGSLNAFRRLKPGPELYEQEIEDLVWDDLEAFTGAPLFPVARQPRIPGSGIPDVVALDENGSVVVIEIKRDVDRSQLAQILEYAGWARLTNLDEIAGLYARDGEHQGSDAFFNDWQSFTETAAPQIINPQPQLYLVARDFEDRTRSALDFLQENGLPITVVPVTVFEDPAGRRIVDIDTEHEPAPKTATAPATSRPKTHLTVNGKRIAVADLLDADLLEPDEHVEFVRPRLGEHYEATILADGTFALPDGTIKQTPSGAAMHAADLVAYDGWYAWRVVRLGGTRLHELREQLIQQVSDSAEHVAADPIHEQTSDLA